MEIKPCPYCGSTNVKIENSCGAWMAYCGEVDKCGNMGFVGTHYTYYDDILKVWNNRFEPRTDNEEPRGVERGTMEKC